MKRKVEIVPSILAADFGNLEREVKAIADAGADRIHCDVMDGHFVPNLSFGPPIIQAVKKHVAIPLDVHLMISNPADYIGMYCDAGADTLIIHAEICHDIAGIVSSIKRRGVRAGVTVNPDKDIDLFIQHLSIIDQVLIMTVYAGFGAQRLIPETIMKVRRVHDKIAAQGLPVDIEVDGGINQTTVGLCAHEGANVFVSGSYVFSGPNYRERIEILRQLALEETTRDEAR